MTHFQINGISGFRAECVRRAQGHRTTQLIINHVMMIHGVGHSRLFARGRAVYIMVALPQPIKSRTTTSENCHSLKATSTGCVIDSEPFRFAT